MRRSSQIRYVSLGSQGPGTGPNGGRPPGGLLGQIVALVVGAAVFAVAIFLGAIFLAGLVGLVLIVGTVFMLRLWWIKRQMERFARENGDLNAEYTVVEESEPRK